jgi:SAM-dependent methyltransferase
VWLAARGLRVTLVDIAEAALERAATAAAAAGLALETQQLDLDSEPLPPGPYDLITCFNFLDRRLFPAIRERLNPGGVFVYAQPTCKNLERNAHPSARFLLDEEELPGLVSGLEIVRHEEGWWADRHEARLVARR